MKLTDLDKLISSNTRVKIYIHYGYKNWNAYLRWDCLWSDVMNDEKKDDYIVDGLEPHTDHLYIGVHK